MTDKNFDDFDRKLDELLRLPRFSPSADFSDRVMSQVALFQQRSPARAAVAAPIAHPPVRIEWAVPPAIARWIPQSRPARFAAGALATVTSLATTAAAVILVAQFSLLSFISTVAFERMGMAITIWGANLVNDAIGQTALEYINAGGQAQSALVMGGLAVGGITAFAALNKAASFKPATI